MVGINHVALEVGDVDQAVDFYSRIFDVELRGRVHGMAFLDMGDQFLALAQAREPNARGDAHLGLVVDDRPRVRRALDEAGVELEPSRGLHFRDPWGNLIEVVQYSEVQFTKAPAVLQGMDLGGLHKSEKARKSWPRRG
jgi:catechol 2,3-dioxygenase-like lactoylglutathione lyase family enzyme